MSLASVIRSEQKLLLPTYDRHKILLDRGRGVYLWDASGDRYLDFLSGIGVNALGYGHPRIQAVIKRQAVAIDSCVEFVFSRISVRAGEAANENFRIGSCFFLQQWN